MVCMYSGSPPTSPAIEEMLTRMSIAPKASSVSFTTLATSSGSVTSHSRARALPPRPSISAFTSSSASRLREQRTTLAPASESASAMYCPSPRPPPVTTAVLPLKRNRSSADERAWASVSIGLLSGWSFPPPTIPALHDGVTLFLEDPEQTLPITWGYLWGTLLAWIGPASRGTKLKGAFDE